MTDTDAARSVADARRAYLQALLDVQALAHQLTPDTIDLPTDCPGWSVRDHVAHVGGLESTMLGRPRPEHEPDWSSMGHVRNDAGRFMEVDVDLRRRWPWETVLLELDEVLAERVAAIATLPDDPDFMALGALGQPRPLIPMLPVRAFDVWQHEQDVRRALGRPAAMNAPAVPLAISRIRGAVPSVLVEDVHAPAGTTVRWSLTGEHAQEFVVAVSADGSAAEVDPGSVPEPATTSITTDAESFTLLGSGRRTAAELPIQVSGDEELGNRLLAEMTVTP